MATNKRIQELATAAALSGTDLALVGQSTKAFQVALSVLTTHVGANLTGAQIKTAYEGEADTNEFSDAEQTKLAGIETSATADQTDAEVETAYNAQVGVVSQAAAEAGTATVAERWTPQRVAQAISALESGKVVQMVNTQTGALATGTTVLPGDDSIPQITEGNEYMTLAITPLKSTNLLIIEVVGVFGTSINSHVTMALFQDATAGALAAVQEGPTSSNTAMPIPLRHKMTTGTTSATTFRIRAGMADAGTTTFNGTAASRKLGGVQASSITILEFEP